MKATKVNKYRSIISSLSFKFLSALLLVAVVPIGVSFFVFAQISEFNQQLQKEAVDSIDGVSEIYRSWVNNESERIILIQKNVLLQLEPLFERHHVTNLRDFIQNSDLKNDIQALFDETIASNRLFFDIRLVVDRVPVVKSTVAIKDRSAYKLHAASIPIRFKDAGQETVAHPEEEEASGEMMQVVAQPVSLDESEAEYRPTGNGMNLPSSVPEQPRVKAQSLSGVELVMLVGLERDKSILYEKLGEKRYLHGSILTLDSEKETNVTDIYEKVFIWVSVFVLMLSFGLALGISIPLARRMSELARMTQAVANGDLNAKVKVHGNDQLSHLMLQFNAMVDEVRKAQESKAYIERMQAWQEVARRLAHEIKNPLTPIVLSVQQLDRKFDDYLDRPQKYRKLLDDVVEIVNDETKTLRKLVKNFSEFARMPIPEMKATHFCAFVQQVVEQNPQFSEVAQIKVVAPDEKLTSLEVDLDTDLIRRVLVNIIRNGIEAAQDANIAPIVELSFVLDETGDPRMIGVDIVDNGPGLTDEQKSKLFMPYFTTKADGTGLGLAIVRKIVEEHHGRIVLGDRDDKERGTQARIQFPVCLKS